MARYRPTEVMPAPVADAVEDVPYWFVIGGHAVRCLAPYRPSRDVDFGVERASSLDDLIGQLEARGEVVVTERAPDTVHLLFEGLHVSVFVLERLAPYVEDRRLNVEGILATKLHAILDRGLRRDFFDLYVTMQTESLGLAQALGAFRSVFGTSVDDGLLLRALTYFDDAEREVALPGEGVDDWKILTTFLLARVGDLLVPPGRRLDIQARVVDVRKDARPR